MPTRRIKESYGPPVVPKDATPQQRQAILQEHRKHIDFVKQLNDLRAAQDDEVTALQGRLAQRVIVVARLRTTGTGGFSINNTSGATASIVAGRIRLTFPEPRPTINGFPHYSVSTIQIGTGRRFFGVGAHLSTLCDLVILDNGGVEFNMATTPNQDVLCTINDFD